MKRLPIWMVGMLAVLTGLLIWVGIIERHELGPTPLILGIFWALFTLGAAKNVFADED